jgi:Transposase DDE domain group 1
VRLPGGPSVAVGTTRRAVTAHAGAVLLRDVMQVVGLVSTTDACLGLKQRARGLSEGQFVAAMAESVALGARCLDDLDVARADQAQKRLRGFDVPAPQTAGTWLRRFTLGHIRQLDKALAGVQRTAYRAAGVRSVTLDFDATYIFSRSKRRQGADRTYKRGYALHPLLCFDAASGAAVHARLRRGKAGPSTGMKTFLTEALRRVPDGVAVRARLDSGFYGGSLLDHMHRAGVTYLCGVPLIPRILQAATGLADECWVPCVDKDEGEVAEFGYRMRDSRRFRRYIVKRIPIADGEQPTLDSGDYHYWVLVTNDHQADPTTLEAEHRHKAQVEAGMRELKSNFGLHALRKHGFMVNWVWLLLVCLGHNLCCWAQQLGQLAAGRDGATLRAKRFRYRYLTIPALLVRSGRRLTLKLPEAYPHRNRFVDARHRLRDLALAA